MNKTNGMYKTYYIYMYLCMLDIVYTRRANPV